MTSAKRKDGPVGEAFNVVPETGTVESRRRRHVQINYVYGEIGNGRQITALLIENKGRRGKHPGRARRLTLFPPTPQGNHVDKGGNTWSSDTS